MAFAQTVAATESAAELRFESGVRGAIVEGQIGTSRAGDALMFEIGGQIAGLRTLRDGRWIFLDMFDFSCGRDRSVAPAPDPGQGGCPNPSPRGAH